MNSTRITIGIPTFNEEKNILEFFENIKNQNNYNTHIKNSDIIFVDDSYDKTMDILEKIKIENPSLNIKIFHNDKRKGASNAWNTIFTNAEGGITILLDADIKLDKNCITKLVSNINEDVGLCASNTIPIINEKNIFSKASGFIGHWLRSIRLYGLSQYTTMGRALAINTKCIKDIKIPEEIIAIDLYLQCKVLEKGKKVVYDDTAKIYFETPNNINDFLSQVTRAMVGHSQIKNYASKFNFNLPSYILIKEFIKNSLQYPKESLSLIFCYSALPYNYFKNKSKINYLWEIAQSTKE